MRNPNCFVHLKNIGVLPEGILLATQGMVTCFAITVYAVGVPNDSTDVTTVTTNGLATCVEPGHFYEREI